MSDQDGHRTVPAAHAATADDQSGEGDLGGMKTTFPHVVATAPAFRASPFSDAVLLDLARGAIDAEYRQGAPFLLEVSFSANDIVGHAFGPDSWEAWEELRRVDRTIADLMTTLDARFGFTGAETREGTFHVTRKSRDHVSSLYRTSMPFAMFFSGGQAVHYSPYFARDGYNGGSHGCVNLRDYDGARWLFDHVPLGTTVYVYRS